MRVTAVEYVVCRWPKGLEGWRMFRLEYGMDQYGGALAESTIWVPPSLDIEQLEELLGNAGSSSGSDEHPDSGGP